MISCDPPSAELFRTMVTTTRQIGDTLDPVSGINGATDLRPQVSILIVAYNSLEHIHQTLGAVFDAMPRARIEVLLIDNGTDGTGDVATRAFPDLIVVPSRGNIGFGPGNNVLARVARAPLLLLLNPDMVLSPGTIDRLVEASQQRPDAAAWGGITLSPDGSADLGNHLRVPKLRHFLPRLIFRGDREVPPIALQSEGLVQVEIIMGGLALINRRFWDEAGGFDESFFLYAEETDLFVRAKLAGWKLWRTTQATAMHYAGSGQTLTRSRLLYQATGQMHFMRKHWPWPKALLGGLLVWLLALERFLAGRLIGSRAPSIRQLGQAYSLVATQPWLWFNGYHSAHWRKILKSMRSAPMARG